MKISILDYIIGHTCQTERDIPNKLMYFMLKQNLIDDNGSLENVEEDDAMDFTVKLHHILVDAISSTRFANRAKANIIKIFDQHRDAIDVGRYHYIVDSVSDIIQPTSDAEVTVKLCLVVAYMCEQIDLDETQLNALILVEECNTRPGTETCIKLNFEKTFKVLNPIGQKILRLLQDTVFKSKYINQLCRDYKLEWLHTFFRDYIMEASPKEITSCIIYRSDYKRKLLEYYPKMINNSDYLSEDSELLEGFKKYQSAVKTYSIENRYQKYLSMMRIVEQEIQDVLNSRKLSIQEKEDQIELIKSKYAYDNLYNAVMLGGVIPFNADSVHDCKFIVSEHETLIDAALALEFYINKGVVNFNVSQHISCLDHILKLLEKSNYTFESIGGFSRKREVFDECLYDTYMYFNGKGKVDILNNTYKAFFLRSTVELLKEKCRSEVLQVIENLSKDYSLHRDSEETKQEIIRLNTENERLRNQNAQLIATMKKQDTEIICKTYNNTINTLHSEIEDLQTKLKDKQAVIDNMQPAIWETIATEEETTIDYNLLSDKRILVIGGEDTARKVEQIEGYFSKCNAIDGCKRSFSTTQEMLVNLDAVYLRYEFVPHTANKMKEIAQKSGVPCFYLKGTNAIKWLETISQSLKGEC